MVCFQGAKALEEFIDNIKNDPDKASNMPRDGTVHELTNHVSATDIFPPDFIILYREL